MSRITAYHASPVADVASFSPGSHFGSRAAALERASATKFQGCDMHLYEVEIAVARPLEIWAIRRGVLNRPPVRYR